MSEPSIPLISVLMSVYNGKPYLNAAVQSILQQSVADFEFIIIDDLSQDGSREILEEYARQDKRIKLIKNEARLGLGVNLKHGVQIAKGTWIARMDGDDISHQMRLQTQLEYANNHPDIDIIGSYATDIDAQGREIGTRKCPLSNEDIVKYIWTCPLIHPTVFMKKSSLLKAGSYGTEKRRQDYALWFRCAKAGLKFANIPQPLLQYRFTGEYFQKNNLKALLTQVKIGLRGCMQVKASPIAYIGVTVPLIKGVLPVSFGMFISKLMKKFDPRNR